MEEGITMCRCCWGRGGIRPTGGVDHNALRLEVWRCGIYGVDIFAFDVAAFGSVFFGWEQILGWKAKSFDRYDSIRGKFSISPSVLSRGV